MEPRIQYAKTADGVRIAFWALGEGMPLIETPSGVSHIQLEWQLPGVRRVYERLAEKRMLVRYDPRGSGLSDRDVTEVSLDTCLTDLEAVVDRLGLERFDLFGVVNFGPAAIAYAASHPERVSRLILWCTYARVSALRAGSPQAQAIFALQDKDWEVFTETAAHIIVGWSAGDEARRIASLLRAAISPETYRRAAEAWAAFDVTDLLARIQSPTLVMHRREAPYPSVDQAKELAAGIPDARLVVLEGQSLVPVIGDLDSVICAIDEFLGEGEESAPQPLPSGMTAILFADIADSTGLTERLGDAAFREKARALDGALRGVIRENGGTPVEGRLLGDGVLAVFTSARQAIEAALACGRAGDEAGLPLHLGLHAGDVIREENNVYGGAVNIAARISALSAPGELLVSDTLRGLARTSAGVTFEDHGERELKGVSEPVRVWAVLRQAQDERESA